jgi:hypothetical protein
MAKASIDTQRLIKILSEHARPILIETLQVIELDRCDCNDLSPSLLKSLR